MPQYGASIIIPAFNQWHLTRACLEALAGTCAKGAVEILLVDNASKDATASEGPSLGHALFGEAFRCLRQPENINFGPACNVGAKEARSDFLIFLNNDTIPLSGWLEPLLEDFAAFPDMGATGPLLLYPESWPFGHTVQHLGVCVDELFRLKHLYEGIPADSPLAGKRRFFQVITAACLAIRRELFIGAGMFDEAFVNGFEDVDLCARLWHRGYRMTVNPASRVIHLQGQTPGRRDHEAENSRLIFNGSMKYLRPDQNFHMEQDGLKALLTSWLQVIPESPEAQSERPDRISSSAGYEELKNMLIEQPFWSNGWKKLLEETKEAKKRAILLRQAFMLFKSPEMALELAKEALKNGDRQSFSQWSGTAFSFCRSKEGYIWPAKRLLAVYRRLDLEDMALQAGDWLKHADELYADVFLPCMEKIYRLAKSSDTHLDPRNDDHYNLWRVCVDIPRRQALQREAAGKEHTGPAFSILMPVFNPKPEHLREALDSILAQDYPFWEACLADDASTDPKTRKILEEYRQKDSRFKVFFREENGHIAAATNSALEMAAHPYAALLDQDDLLAPDALRIVAEHIQARPEAILLFSDEDKIDEAGLFRKPYFKNDKWDWELLAVQNFVNHLGVYRRDRLREIGGFRDEFRGSQDYEMLLRYVRGMDEKNFIHIPHVLYHWRSHSGSTAQSLKSKAYAAEKGWQVSLEWAASRYPGAKIAAPGQSLWPTIRHPAPRPFPETVLVYAPKEDVEIPEEFVDAWFRSDRLAKFLIVCAEPLHSQLKKMRRSNLHLIRCAPGLGRTTKLNMAAKMPVGEVIGFIGDIMPAGSDCLKEIVSVLWREGTGAVEGKVMTDEGILADAGYMVDAGGSLRNFLGGQRDRQVFWFGAEYLDRSITAPGPLCMFTKRRLFKELDGLDESMGDWAIQDYGLRLALHGQPGLWHPEATFRAFALQDQFAPPPEEFEKRWQGRLAPYNENLGFNRGRPELCTN